MDVRRKRDEEGFRPGITPKVEATIRRMHMPSKPSPRNSRWPLHEPLDQTNALNAYPYCKITQRSHLKTDSFVSSRREHAA